MNAPGGRKGPFLIVLVLLLLSIVVDRGILVTIFPWLSHLGGISPMIVFLDIPLPLPTIDVIPVTVIFTLLYFLVTSIYDSLSSAPILPAPATRGRVVLKGALGLLCWVLVPAVFFYFAQGFLPREVRNGINSFGLDADIYLPYPGIAVIHLQGSMLTLIGFCIGIRLYARKVNRMELPAPEPVSVDRGAQQQEKQETRGMRAVREKRQVREEVHETRELQDKQPLPAPVRKPQLRTPSVPVVAPLPVIAPLPEMETVMA